MNNERLTKILTCIAFISTRPKINILEQNMFNSDHATVMIHILTLDILLELGCDYKKIAKDLYNDNIKFAGDISPEDKVLFDSALGIMMSVYFNKEILTKTTDKILAACDTAFAK